MSVVVCMLGGMTHTEQVWRSERTIWLKDRLHAAADMNTTCFEREAAEKWSRGAPPSHVVQLRYQGREINDNDTWGELGIEVFRWMLADSHSLS